MLEPTCGVEGKKAYACQCGDKYTEAIPATGNHGSTSLYYGGFYYEPFCERPGYAGVRCDICGKNVGAVSVEAAGHIQDEDFWNAHNVCGESGTGAFVSIPCKICGNNTENRPITAQHNFVKTGSFVGEFDITLYIYECTGCGKTYNDYD